MILREAISGNAPSSATTAVVGSQIAGLDKFNTIEITAEITGNTGGTLDVYVQRYDDGNDQWVDWIHFPQRSAGAAIIRYAVSGSAPSSTIQAVGVALSPALSANAAAGGHPGSAIRCIATSGASTTSGGAIVISVRGRR